MKPPCKKRRKVQKEEDRISKLPDEILVSILCFLSTEEAAKTSVLSRRWEKLWLNKIVNSPSLDLYINKLMKLPLYRVNDSETYDYIKRVNQFIKLHQLPMLDEFTIGFHLDSRHSDDIDTWVQFAAKKQVKILKLEFGITCFSPKDGELPNYDIKFLANVRMHGLRDLFLGRVNVGENMLESVISNSPLLERLSVGVSVLFEKLEIVATNLKYLMLDACSNLRHLKISAPNLNMMELFSFERLNHIDISAPNLSTASLTLFLRNLRSFWYHEMLAHLPQVKILKLTTTTLGIRKMEDVPELSKVEHLEIYLYEEFRVPFGWSCHLLQAVPFLHSLSIKLDKCEYDDLKLEDIDFLWMLEDIPKKVKVKVEAEGSPSHQYLKVVELIGFSGCRNEIESLLQLFEGAVSLEKIIIQVCRSSDQYAKLCLECAELLKAHMRSKLDVVII